MAEQSDYWILEKALEQIDPDLVDKWGGPNKHPETQFSKEEAQALLGLEQLRAALLHQHLPEQVTQHPHVAAQGLVAIVGRAGGHRAILTHRGGRRSHPVAQVAGRILGRVTKAGRLGRPRPPGISPRRRARGRRRRRA